MEEYEVCNNRCPEDYGQQEVLAAVVVRLGGSDNTVVRHEDVGCLRICTRFGGTGNRPVGGIGNFTLSIDGGLPRDGVFGIEGGVVVKRLLDEQ